VVTRRSAGASGLLRERGADVERFGVGRADECLGPGGVDGENRVAGVEIGRRPGRGVARQEGTTSSARRSVRVGPSGWTMTVPGPETLTMIDLPVSTLVSCSFMVPVAISRLVRPKHPARRRPWNYASRGWLSGDGARGQALRKGIVEEPVEQGLPLLCRKLAD
jgi:hypothetical protein